MGELTQDLSQDSGFGEVDTGPWSFTVMVQVSRLYK
jgi:hypothetical protein